MRILRWLFALFTETETPSAVTRDFHAYIRFSTPLAGIPCDTRLPETLTARMRQGVKERSIAPQDVTRSIRNGRCVSATVSGVPEYAEPYLSTLLTFRFPISDEDASNYGSCTDEVFARILREHLSMLVEAIDILPHHITVDTCEGRLVSLRLDNIQAKEGWRAQAHCAG